MTDNSIDLTRRKILGSVGAIGVAGATAGYGTSAYFSDEETFEDNQLTAGELDLKVDWEEHYYDGSQDVSGLDVQYVRNSVPDGYRGFPTEKPTVAVNDDDVGAFMNATSIEAYPDPDGDGIQDAFASEPGETTDEGVGYICEDGADTSEDLNPNGGLRTENHDTLTENGDPAPLIALDDVKPGDFGELTLSYHLCDNPGYVWLQGQLVNASENGLTEPEEGDGDDDDSQGELLDNVQTKWWYDDGNNLLESGGGDGEPADVVIVFDESGSMDGDTGDPSTSDKWNNALDGARSLVSALGPNANVGLVSFSSDAQLREGLTNDKSAVQGAIDDIESDGPGGLTDIEEAVDAGRSELTGSQTGEAGINPSGNNRSNARRIMVFMTNGTPTSGGSESEILNSTGTAKNSENTTIYGIAYGSGANEELVEDMSSPPKTDDGTIDADDEFAFIGGIADIQSIFTGIGETISGGETVFFEGSLREALAVLSDGSGFPLDANPSTEDRDCFEASTDHYIGFEWRVPTSVGNEIQGDSAAFDLGFYTEQCRHNDGSGPSRETTTSAQ